MQGVSPIDERGWTENIFTITVPFRIPRHNKATGFYIARGRTNIQRPHSTHKTLNLSKERLPRDCKGSVAPWMPSANQGIQYFSCSDSAVTTTITICQPPRLVSETYNSVNPRLFLASTTAVCRILTRTYLINWAPCGTIIVQIYSAPSRLHHNYGSNLPNIFGQ